MANSNPDPLKARQAKRKKAKPPNIQSATEVVWKALQTATKILADENATMKLKACHAVFQGAQAFAKLYEVGELEARLSALEADQSPAPQSKGSDHAESLN
jgi:hypothetical protein